MSNYLYADDDCADCGPGGAEYDNYYLMTTMLMTMTRMGFK